MSHSKIVMYVDDDPYLLDIFMQELTHKMPEHTCLIFKNPYEALDFLKADNDLVDLIVTDQTMPTMSGTDFLLKVVELGYENDFIVFSGNCDDTVSFNLLKAELSSKNLSLTARMIEKPNFNLLMDAVKGILEDV